MQRWRDELSKHPLMTTIKTLEEAINTEHNIDDPIFEVERARFIKIIDVLKKVLDDLDPDLAPMDVLSNIQNVIRSHGALTSVQNFAADGNQNHIVDANNQITNILGYIYQLSSLKFSRSTRRSDLDAATSSFEKFSKQVSGRYDALTESASQAAAAVAANASEIAGMRVEAETTKEDLAKSVAEWKAQTAEKSIAATSEFNAFLGEAKKKNLSLANSLEEKFIERMEALHKRVEDRTEDATVNLNEKLDEILLDAADKRTKILGLYELVAHDSVTGGHKQIADREYSAAENWRWGTIASVAITLLWMVFSLTVLEPRAISGQVFWLDVAKSAAITALLVSFSVYASKQANLHRVNERKARAFFLQVQAFDPFVASLPEESRSELKKLLSERIFGSSELISEDSALEQADFKGMDHLTAMMERILKAVKK